MSCSNVVYRIYVYESEDMEHPCFHVDLPSLSSGELAMEIYSEDPFFGDKRFVSYPVPVEVDDEGDAV